MDMVRAGQSFAMATVVWRQPPSSGQQGSRALVTEDGHLHGWIGGACAEPVLIREAKRVMAEGSPSLIWLGQEADLAGVHVPAGVVTVPISCQSDGALQIYIEPVMATPHVIVVGRSPMAVTLHQLLADLDWRSELLDYPDFAPTMIGRDTVVVVATQGHGDEEALEIALQADPVMVGLVASRKRGEVVKDFLADRGVGSDKLQQVRVPMGVDLGHTSHREIAVSILAELVQQRAAGALKPRTGTSLSGTCLTIVEPDQVVDLVCGMTVEAVAANRPFTYQGTTYYFCAMGCRVAFESDPVSFIPQEAPC